MATWNLVNADNPTLARSAIGAAGLTADKNVWTGQHEINGHEFSNSYDTDLWIAGTNRVDPTVESQGLWIQHRVTGDLGDKVHDACATELRINGASNAGVGLNAHEASLVVTGGANSVDSSTACAGVVANFHTSGTPSGSINRVALLEATQIPALGGTFSIGTVYGLRLDNQIVGDDNFSIHAPTGKSVLGPIVPNDSSSIALVARARSDTPALTAILSAQTSASTGVFQITATGTGGMGTAVTGCVWWVNTNIVGGTAVGMRVQGAAGQTADMIQIRDSAGTSHIRFTLATAAARSNLVMGQVSTSATDGFIHMNWCNGVPTGTPTNYSAVPVVIDTANSKLMAYIGGAWKGVTLA